MKRINFIAIALLCNHGYIYTMQKLLEQSSQTKNNHGVYISAATHSFDLNDGKETLESFNKKRVYDPERLRVSGPAITYGLPWRETPKASFILSMPIMPLIAGTTAYEYGLPLVPSIGCSLAVALSYVAILKKILC